MKSATVALIALALLTACSGAPSKPHHLMLPDVPAYSKAVQKQAAAEMTRACDQMPTVCDVLLPDYKVMREQARAAKKLLK